jgi:hypothetical protein
MDEAGSADYCTRIFTDPAQIRVEQWNSLLNPIQPAQRAGALFLRHEYLCALHESRCATRETGWEPHYLTLWDRSDRLAAATPLYRKHHSYGEYVFDWSWAEAHERHGIAYYPKWLVAVPFTPVPGPRLLAIDEAANRHLAAELLRLARQSTLSSLHVLFASPEDAARLAQIGLRTRRAVQFHWINRGYSNFDDYLSALTQPKRKKVRAERRRVSAAGISFVRKTGEQISADDWRFFARCYANTYAAHHSTAYLNPQFFRRLATSMREHLLLVLAMRDGVRVAASFALFDDERLYGRYWGTTQDIDCLHFETSYYQMIEFAIERGLRVFEGGAQGEHKHARGFEPVTTSSSHWLAHPAFDAAVGHALVREGGGIEAYVDELEERSALKRLGDPQ